MTATDRETLSALVDHSVSPRILDIHLDDCDDDACQGCAPQHLAEKAAQRSVDAQFPIVAAFLADGGESR
ncbi:hypothetical protein [Streptomyces sp. NPDC096339]|uniref:hypothetical protein n=1 Tax=Streptomyces sp. NPDC096339 TaxID=3366086 RepID=UPI00380D3892